MPELPELQADAERLSEEFVDRVLMDFKPLSFTALKTVAPKPDSAFGCRLHAVGRRGKHLLLRFGDDSSGSHGSEPPAMTFVVHLMQGGRLKPDEKQSPRPRGGIARWIFDSGPALLLTEAGKEKRAGVWVVVGDVEGQEPILGLGPDADRLSATELSEIMKGRSARLHGVLRDQRAAAGIGRRLANEICHRAKLSPFANASKLDPAELGRLLDAIRECIDESLTYERSRSDMSSSKERPGNVHHRTGEPCPVCDDVVRAVEYRGYTICYCPTCQTGGRALADNTTSKFLK